MTAGARDFAAVRHRLTGAPRTLGDRPATFVVWDLLHLDARSIRHRSLAEREAALRELLPARGPAWCLAEPLDDPVEQVLEVLAEHELEGLIATPENSLWHAGRRTRDWRSEPVRRLSPQCDSTASSLRRRDAKSRAAH